MAELILENVSKRFGGLLAVGLAAAAQRHLSPFLAKTPRGGSAQAPAGGSYEYFEIGQS